jgi:hypothetical protein
MGCRRTTPTVPNCPPRLSPPRVAAPLGPAPCPSAAELSAIDVPISFEGDGSGGTLVCREADGSWDLTQVQKNAYRALLFMKTVEFDAPLPWTNQNLYQWFRRAVVGIRVRTDIRTNGCCSPAGVINLLGTIVEENSLSSGFLEMMVHEGRHAEGRPHTCDTNDRTVDEMGAYGVQYSLMLWIGSHWPQATQAEKEFALNRVTLLRASGVFCEECE